MTILGKRKCQTIALDAVTMYVAVYTLCTAQVQLTVSCIKCAAEAACVKKVRHVCCRSYT